MKAGKVICYQCIKCKNCDRHFTNTPLRGKLAAMKALAVVLYNLCNASMVLRVSNVAAYKWIKAEASRLPELSTQSVKGVIQIDEL